MNQPTTKPLRLIALAAVLGLGVNYALAWTGPTSAPPSGNTPAPINVGGATQIKSGSLGVADFVANSVTVGSTANASAITSPKFCIGNSCITSWPTNATDNTTIVSYSNLPSGSIAGYRSTGEGTPVVSPATSDGGCLAGWTVIHLGSFMTAESTIPYGDAYSCIKN